MKRTFWKNKRVFLTGHTGFKGSWLSLWLQHLGADVCGYALSPPTDPSLFVLAEVHRGMESIEGDIRDLKKLQATMNKFNPEIVIHMAAQSLVRESYLSPVETYNTNVMGTVHVLEAMRKHPDVKSCVIVTSDKCYENRETLEPYCEDEPMGGHDPYANSKGCAELVTSAYRRSFFSDRTIASARAGNVIGGGDWAQDRLVPDIMRALQKGEPVKIRNPDAIRPWQHVLEPLHGYLLLCEKLYSRPDFEYAEGWNFGPNKVDVLNVSEIADQLVSLWGKGTWVATQNEDNLHEATLLNLDSFKAQEKLEWQPRLNIKTALKWIVDWHRAMLSEKNMRDFSLEQIQKYEMT